MSRDDRELLADVHLLGLTAEAREGSSSRREFEGALGAAVAVGLVPDGEAAVWQGFFDGFDAPDPEPDGSGLAVDRALELLDRLARELAAAGGEDEELHAYIRFMDALGALSHLGALSGDEVDWWARRIGEVPDEDDVDDGMPGDARLLRLRAVYPGGPARETATGAQVRIVSLECYEDGVLVRWERSSAPEDPEGGDDDLEVRDDAGTAYWYQGGGSGAREGAGRVVTSGDSTFVPAPPADARAIRVTLAGVEFEFDVSGLAGGEEA